MTQQRNEGASGQPGVPSDLPGGGTAAAARSFREGELIANRFRIVRHLGSGGMGSVYEAVDLELGRIALKTIRPDVDASREQLSRFKQEVLMARKVSSPNVCRIHELHTATVDGDRSPTLFLTMEFLEGVTLSDRIRDRGPLPWRDAQSVAIEICSGLQSIHQGGIIHRDIKGRNIMLANRDGRACTVVMDFGIARQLSEHSGETATALTQQGAIVGTPEYMAPEQFEGKEVSPATDIYALGIVLHEALTGKHPFTTETASARQSRRPERAIRPSKIQPGVPRRLDRIIAKCLEYDPSRRYQSAKEMAEAIQGGPLLSFVREKLAMAALGLLSSVIVLTGLLLIPAIGDRVRGLLLASKEKHIAVLPIDVVGATPETQALGDGLMDSLADKLTNVDVANQSLWVVPASEVRSRKVNDPSAALREFGATIVLKGSFERNGDTARLKLTLIDSRKTREIGFVDVATQTGDLAELQDEAVTRLGRLMNISVKADAARGISEAPTGLAYEDYLAGIGYFQRHDKPGNIELAITSLKKAVKLDPRFALSFAHLAQVYIMKYRLESDPQDIQQAETYAKKAAGLSAQIPSTYVALGQIHELTGKYDLAIEEFKRAVSLDSRDADAIAGLAISYREAQPPRMEEAKVAYFQAAALRPNDWTGYNNLGNFYLNSGDPDDAIAQFDHALKLTPDNSWIYANLGMAYMNSHDANKFVQAEDALKKSIAISPNIGAYSSLAFLYIKQNHLQKSIAASQAALKLNDQNPDLWGILTFAYEWQRENDKANFARKKAIDLLERSVELNPQSADDQATLAALYAKNGLREKALNCIYISLALSPDSKYVFSQVADAYESLGNRSKAVEYARKALDHGLDMLQLEIDPEMQGVLSDPRFQKSKK